MKVASFISFRNKEQKSIVYSCFSIVGALWFCVPVFFACPVGCASKIACPKNWARLNIFVQPCLKLIFKSCLESGKFPSEWKKTNVVPVHEKGDKQISKKLLVNIITFYYWKNP